MEVQAPTSNKEDQAVARKAALLERTKKLREKEWQQAEFIANCTLANVLVDAEYPKSLKCSTDTTVIQSIKGVRPNLLGHNVLRQFMIINKLQNYWNKSKSEMCRMIVERKKNENLDQIMYAKDFDGSDKDDDVDDSWDVEEDTAVGDENKKMKRLSKGAKPTEISEDGTLYRLILTYFLQELPHLSVSWALIRWQWNLELWASSTNLCTRSWPVYTMIARMSYSRRCGKS
jgi:hypothetical protein